MAENSILDGTLKDGTSKYGTREIHLLHGTFRLEEKGADSWFCWAYHNMAEFIATMPMKETSLKAIEDLVPELSDFTVDGKQCRRAHAARTDPSAPCHDVAQQLSDIEKLPVKFMHPASLATVYELYKKSC